MAKGSSPLTRGKRVAASAVCVTDGLIPAHAGKTDAPAESGYAPRAHPRSRGENSATALAMSYTRGSSPLTRGKPLAYKRKRTFHGLIPAHAGKTGLAP